MKNIEYTERGIMVTPHIVDDITRRDFLVGGAAAILLGGCSGGGEENTSSGETRTVEHALGTTEVPADPRRVVAIHPIVIDTALSMGVEPVGISRTAVSYLSERLPDETESIGEIAQLNLEAIAELGPDLIISLTVLLEENYEEMSQIAPTVGVYFGDANGEWQRTSCATAEALGKTEEFDSDLAAYEERAEEIGRRLGVPGDAPTVAILTQDTESLRFDLPGNFSGSVVYRDLGLPLPEGLRVPAEEGEAVLEVSREELGRGDAEAIILSSSAPTPEDRRQEIEQIREDPLFRILQAVDSGDVYAPGQHWQGGGLIAANLALDDIERFLIEGTT